MTNGTTNGLVEMLYPGGTPSAIVYDPYNANVYIVEIIDTAGHAIEVR